MRVDYHVHLEEGPYDLSWIQKTSLKMSEFFEAIDGRKDEKSFAIDHITRLLQFLKEGPFTPNHLDKYLLQAKKIGLKQVGIVDHLYRFHETRPYFEKYMLVDDSPIGTIQKKWLDAIMVEDLDRYIHFIESQKQKWSQNGVELRLGLEADYFEGGETELEAFTKLEAWDFVIGSVHFQNGWGFDNPTTKYIYEEKDILKMYSQHFKTIEALISSQLFDFVAHLDNMKVFNYRPEENHLVEIYKGIAGLLKKHNMATEISSGLKYRYPVKESCPSPSFLQILAECGVPFTLSSDAHYPSDLGMLLEDSIEQLKNQGITEIATFHRRSREMVPL